MVSWPAPIDWGFVKRDNQSLAHLRSAQSEWQALACQTDDRHEQSRPPFEIWRLACLANDPDRQAEAEAFCQTLLAQDPTNHRALAWALARHYTVDLQASEKALEAVIGDDEDDF